MGNNPVKKGKATHPTAWYPYMALFDETQIVHSQIIEEVNMQKIIVHFERPTEDGFDYARCEFPEYKWIQKKAILMKKSLYLSNCLKVMRICCTNMRQKEESRLPNLFTVSGYLKKNLLLKGLKLQSDVWNFFLKHSGFLGLFQQTALGFRELSEQGVMQPSVLETRILRF